MFDHTFDASNKYTRCDTEFLWDYAMSTGTCNQQEGTFRFTGLVNGVPSTNPAYIIDVEYSKFEYEKEYTINNEYGLLWTDISPLCLGYYDGEIEGFTVTMVEEIPYYPECVENFFTSWYAGDDTTWP